jgi:hypothetical protein
MPLLPGPGADVHQKNVEELMHKFHKTGQIGRIKPRSEAHARRIANAIAYKESSE